MRTFVKIMFFGIALLCIFLVFADIALMEDRNVRGIIKEKAAGYNRSTGSFEYHSIIQTEDGYIEDIQGINTYSKPIGTNVTITVRREKK